MQMIPLQKKYILDFYVVHWSMKRTYFYLENLCLLQKYSRFPIVINYNVFTWIVEDCYFKQEWSNFVYSEVALHFLRGYWPCLRGGHEFHNLRRWLYGHHNHAFGFSQTFMGVENNIFLHLIIFILCSLGLAPGHEPLIKGSWISQI